MTVPAAVVLFAVIWFLVLFLVLPLRLKSQDEAGSVVPGTPASAPSDPQLKRKVFWVTVVSVVLWLPLVWVIASGAISVKDIDFFGRMEGE